MRELFSYRDTDYELLDSLSRLNLPKPRTNYLKLALEVSHRGTTLYLTERIRSIRSIGQFKKEINRAFGSCDSHSSIL